MALADLDLPAELTDLAIAAGVIAGPDGELNPAFFADPGASLGKALTDPVQRTALLRLAQRLLDETGGRPPVETDPGTQWVPLAVGGAGNPPSGLYLVVTTEAPDTVVLGVGGMVRHAGPPEVSLTAQLPLVRVAASQSPVFLVGGSDGSLELELDLTLDDGVAAGPSSSTGSRPVSSSRPTEAIRRWWCGCACPRTATPATSCSTRRSRSASRPCRW